MNIGPLRVLAVQHVDIEGASGGLRHAEIYTVSGLVTLLWHGPIQAERVAVCLGGAMGGLLGPGTSLFHEIGTTLASEGIGTVRVSYRMPNDLDACIGDAIAAAMLAEREGAERFAMIGHSFGGAVAVGAAIKPSPIAHAVRGVCTLATQSAGCEQADGLRGRPLLLVHGDRDEILPHWSSEMVREIAGCGELELLPGVGHLLRENGAAEHLRTRIPAWVRVVLG